METNFFGSIPFAIWEFLHHHLQLFNKHGVRGEIKIPLAQGDAHAEEEGVESNSVAWVGDCCYWVSIRLFVG
ncbi:hypothetical protein CMV_026989 [Castanea mollissima]|uniref:Uncharacterized protein n=1 Tax=Castanea mollissima TaxID=60419 RepID=A0A8J4V701_9ROSI|nr:hypothetical protein CMV_026989 [Castanea mollissima]